VPVAGWYVLMRNHAFVHSFEWTLAVPAAAIGWGIFAVTLQGLAAPNIRAALQPAAWVTVLIVPAMLTIQL
jgi:hypothetical protein